MTESRRRAHRKNPAERIRSDTVSAFQPSPAQRNYLTALQEALALRKSASDTAVCASIGISRMTLWKWRQLPEFTAWLRRELDQTSDWNWPLIVHRHELQALQGSVKSAEFIWKVRSGMLCRRSGPVDATAGDPATNYRVKYLTHGPDDVASSVVLPLDDPRLALE